MTPEPQRAAVQAAPPGLCSHHHCCPAWQKLHLPGSPSPHPFATATQLNQSQHTDMLGRGRGGGGEKGREGTGREGNKKEEGMPFRHKRHIGLLCNRHFLIPQAWPNVQRTHHLEQELHQLLVPVVCKCTMMQSCAQHHFMPCSMYQG